MVQLEQVTKRYMGPGGEVFALRDASLRVEAGEFVAIKGPSGSGKSTMLLTIGAMVSPTEGRVRIRDTDVYALTGGARARFRADNIGFVFQLFHLVPYLSVLDNVLLPTLATGGKDKRAEALGLLERFGVSHRVDHRPSELSIGERQRVAMARALLNRPVLLLADEPTGNLDPANAREVMEYLTEFNREGGTVVVVTHEEVSSRYAQRTVLLREGRLDEAEAAAS